MLIFTRSFFLFICSSLQLGGPSPLRFLLILVLAHGVRQCMPAGGAGRLSRHHLAFPRIARIPRASQVIASMPPVSPSIAPVLPSIS